MEGIIFIGLQGSGKSTFYIQEFFKSHIRISLDMVNTRRKEQILLDACINGPQKVVIDNTNPSVEERKVYIDKLKQGKFEVHAYYFNEALEDCLVRNNQRTGKEKIPEVGIKGTAK